MTYQEAITFFQSVGNAGYKTVADLRAAIEGFDFEDTQNPANTAAAAAAISAALAGAESSISPNDWVVKTVVDCATIVKQYLGDPPKQAPVASPAAERSVKKDGGDTTVITRTKGNNADGVDSVERKTPSGTEADTPEGKTKVTVTPALDEGTVTAEHDTQGRAVSSDGYLEQQSAERYDVTGSPNQVQNNTQGAANAARRELVAARSGFNDNRDDSIFSILDEILSVPEDVLKAITVIERKDTQQQADGDGTPKGKNIFTDAWNVISKEVKSVTDYYANVFSKSAIKRAELVIKNKKEKIKKMEERVKKMKDGPLKNKYLQAIAKGDLKTLFSFPIAEKKDLQSTEDKDKVTEIATKAQEKALGAEAQAGV